MTNHALITSAASPWWRVNEITHNKVERVTSLDLCTGGDFLFLVGCEVIVPAEVRNRYKHTLVVHASDLPNGRGWSPWVHELRNGASEICVCLLEASEKVDRGAVWYRLRLEIDKCLLYNEISRQLLKAHAWLIDYAIDNPETRPIAQVGTPSYYRKLTDEDSRIEMDDATFDVVRTCDPYRFPAWVEKHGRRYSVRIEEEMR